MNLSSTRSKRIFAGLITLIVLGILFIRPAVETPLADRSNNKKKESILLLGGAVTFNALKLASMKSVKVINFTKPGARITENYFKLKNELADAFPKTDLVVVTFKDSEFTNMDYPEGARKDSKHRPIGSSREDKKLVAGKTYLNLGEKWAYRLGNRFRFFQASDSWKKRLDKNIRDFARANFRFLLKKRKGNIRKQHHWSLGIREPEYFTQNFENTYLSDLKKLAAENAWDIMLVRSPILPALKKKLRDEEVQDYYLDLNIFCAENGIKFMDANSETYGLADFEDVSYLSEKGAKKYISFLEKAIRDKVSPPVIDLKEELEEEDVPNWKKRRRKAQEQELEEQELEEQELEEQELEEQELEEQELEEQELEEQELEEQELEEQELEEQELEDQELEDQELEEEEWEEQELEEQELEEQELEEQETEELEEDGSSKSDEAREEETSQTSEK